MVKAVKAAEPIRACLPEESVLSDIREQASTSIALVEVLGAVVEGRNHSDGVVLHCPACPGLFFKQTQNQPRMAELRAALAAADKLQWS